MSDIRNRLRFGTALLNHAALIELCEKAADEIEQLQAEVKAEEDTVYSCMAKLKENGAEIERLRAALRMVIDNVETSSYESTGFWRTRHDRHR